MTTPKFTNKILLITALLLTILTQVALGSAAMGDAEGEAHTAQTSVRWVVDTDPAEKLYKIYKSLNEGEIRDLTVRTASMNDQVRDLLNFLVEGTFSGLSSLFFSFDNDQFLAESAIDTTEGQHSAYTLTRGFDNRETIPNADPHRTLAKQLLNIYPAPPSTGAYTKSAGKR